MCQAKHCNENHGKHYCWICKNINSKHLSTFCPLKCCQHCGSNEHKTAFCPDQDTDIKNACCLLIKISAIHAAKVMITTEGRGGQKGKLGLPGGGIDSGEAPFTAAIREAWEELGEKINNLPHKFIDITHRGGSKTRIFLFYLDSDITCPNVKFGREISKREWIDPLNNNIQPADLRNGFYGAWYNNIIPMCKEGQL